MESKNSKVGLFFIIICNVSIVLCFVIGFVSIFKVSPPEKIDSNYFIEYMGNIGCTLIDMQEKENYSGVETYLIVDKKSCPYLVSYATFNDENILKEFFSRTRKDVLKGNTNVRSETSIEINLFSEYYEYSTNGDYYKIVVYSDNSVLYASVDKEYRTEIINIFKDFNYKYELDFGAIKIMGCTLIIIFLIFIVSMWGIEKKIRNKGWISLIPLYNIGCLSKDILGSPWFALLLFLPVGNAIFMIYLFYNMGKVFNKNDTYCVLMIFFPTITLPLLAFDDSTYTKPEKKIIKTHNDVTIQSDIYISTSINQKTIIKKIIDIIKWVFTFIFLLLSAIFVLVYFTEKLIGYIALAFMFLIYGLMICPSLTKFTKKYKNYNTFKPLIVILLIIINFILLAILQF